MMLTLADEGQSDAGDHAGHFACLSWCVAGRLSGRSPRRQPQTREIGSHDNVASEPALLSRALVICLCERLTRYLEGILLLRSDRRDQMRQHQILRTCTLSHGAKIGN